MNNYIFTKSSEGIDVIIRIRKPIFIGEIIESYDISENKTSLNHKGYKVSFNKIYGDYTESKLNWAAKKRINYFLNQTKDVDLIEKNNAFSFIKKNRQFLNISAIEKYCDIKRTSIVNAINRDQEKFGQSDKLANFLDDFFPGWDL